MRAVQDVTVTTPFLARRGDSASTSARAELAPVLVRTLGLAPRAMTAIEARVVMTVLPLEEVFALSRARSRGAASTAASDVSSPGRKDLPVILGVPQPKRPARPVGRHLHRLRPSVTLV